MFERFGLWQQIAGELGKRLWNYELERQRALVVSLRALLWKADHRPEALTEEEEAKLREMLDVQMSREVGYEGGR